MVPDGVDVILMPDGRPLRIQAPMPAPSSQSQQSPPPPPPSTTSHPILDMWKQKLQQELQQQEQRISPNGSARVTPSATTQNLTAPNPVPLTSTLPPAEVFNTAMVAAIGGNGPVRPPVGNGLVLVQ